MGCVAAKAGRDGRRVDLLGSRVLEAPREGAGLLKELWAMTAVPFAAADDARSGFMLSTFMEEPHSGSLSIIASSISSQPPVCSARSDTPSKIKYTAWRGTASPDDGAVGLRTREGMDLYFKKDALIAGMEGRLALQPLPVAPALYPQQRQQQQMPQQPVFAQPAPGKSDQQLLEERMQAAVAAAAGRQHTQVPPTMVDHVHPAARDDVFQQFAAQVAGLGMTPEHAHARFDTDGDGTLSAAEVGAMVAQVLPGASKSEVQHFVAMMDADGDGKISAAEMSAAITSAQEIHGQLRTGSEDTELLQSFQDYLTDNTMILEEYFRTSDADHSGRLDHAEVAAFVRSIPDLSAPDQKYLIAHMYRSDANSDGLLAFDELMACVASFRAPAKVTIAKHVDASSAYGAPPVAPQRATAAAAAPAYSAQPQQYNAQPAQYGAQSSAPQYAAAPQQFAFQPAAPQNAAGPQTVQTLYPTAVPQSPQYVGQPPVNAGQQQQQMLYAGSAPQQAHPGQPR
ncbi:hypothetical protein FOA52_012691 [Chlamydomonas sp. UWO 241]|nr:hypothetical protein FOA52_012691 [Chlamydomonas sp. UWO 241]